MGTAEYKIFIVLATIILLVFIGGIIVFIFQYHRRKMLYEQEKALLHEQHMKELLNTQIEIQEHTMQDIGREIHDNVGQRLILASIYANQLIGDSSCPAGIQARMEEIGGIINESLAELRSLSRSLTVSDTDGKELESVLSNECRRINALNICQTNFEINTTTFTISNTSKIFIVRIVQEFIQNSLKHAECNAINLKVQYADDGLQVWCADDGNGFNINEYRHDAHEGIGLMNMRKRAELIGAEFSMDSKPAGGTVLHLYIPANKLYA